MRRVAEVNAKSLRYGINNFVYSARRPFHPRRLFELLHDKFILLQDNEVDEEDGEGDEEQNDKDSADEMNSDTDSVIDFGQPDPKDILNNKRNHPAFGPVLRSKGFFWLSTRPFQFGEWSQAGGMLTLGCGAPWFVEVPDEAWPEDRDVVDSIKNDFQGAWGDRRQELVFIGEGIDQEKIAALLDGCLLDDHDMRQWENVMSDEKLSREAKVKKLAKLWEDGWEDWPVFEIEDEEELGKHRVSEYSNSHDRKGHRHGHHHR